MFFFPWCPAFMLAMECNHVIGLRLLKLSGGGVAAQDEAVLMIREKAEALLEAGATLLGGGTVDTVLSRYREHVEANSHRLLG